MSKHLYQLETPTARLFYARYTDGERSATISTLLLPPIRVSKKQQRTAVETSRVDILLRELIKPAALEGCTFVEKPKLNQRLRFRLELTPEKCRT